jgi:hypothetical protein
MVKINVAYINSIAPNTNAANKGKALANSSFVSLNKSEDSSLLFGECRGSGAKNYACSIDFINQASPVFRCSCPSRQIPCKHVLGLMYCYEQSQKFKTMAIPEDILQKREKALKRKEDAAKKKQTGPKKVNKAALKKKIQQQIEGIHLAQKLINDIMSAGLASLDVKQIRILTEQVKQLESYYLSGILNSFMDFLLVFTDLSIRKSVDERDVYALALQKITRLHQLCKKGTEYLEKRKEDPELALDKDSTIDELLGYAWQLSELKQIGLSEENAELIQLSFCFYTDYARKEEVDFGTWLNLKNGQIVETKNFRPFKARRHIKQENSIFDIALIPEIYIYPGDLNPRARWDDFQTRAVEANDFQIIFEKAETSLEDVAKKVKNQIKNPLAAKEPAVLLSFKKNMSCHGSISLD